MEDKKADRAAALVVRDDEPRRSNPAIHHHHHHDAPATQPQQAISSSSSTSRQHCVLEVTTPAIPRPRARPISHRERKQALARAVYYSECQIQGIHHADADHAAQDANEWRAKWSGRATRRPSREKRPPPCKRARTSSHVPALTAQLIRLLRTHAGDTGHPECRALVDRLRAIYARRASMHNPQSNPQSNHRMDGTWLALSQSDFDDCQGRNARGERVFSLGRVSFDMFQPTDLSCSLQGVFNVIRPRTAASREIVFPPGLRAQADRVAVRHYDLVFTLTLEPNQPPTPEEPAPTDTTADTPAAKADDHDENTDNDNSPAYVLRRPIRCLLTNHGYCLPDPVVANRLTVWFTGGSLEVEDEESDLSEWKQLFDRKLPPSASVLAARVFAGAHLPDKMADDGAMEYSLRRPLGGAYVDVLYADESLRILHGHHGSMFVFMRVPNPTSSSSSSTTNNTKNTG